MQSLFAKSLADVRAAAAKEFNGVAFDSLVANGRRVILVVCLTGEFERSKLPPGQPQIIAEWDKANLGRLVLNTFMAGGFGYFTNEANDAVLLIAAEPRSMDHLQRAFGLMP